MLRQLCILIIIALIMPFNAFASSTEKTDFTESISADITEQLDALGKSELEDSVPENAKGLMADIGVDELSIGGLLSLTPADFFATIWQVTLYKLKTPLRVFGAITGIILLCTMVSGLKTAAAENMMSPTYKMVAILCIVTSISAPLISSIRETSVAIKDTSVFMLTYIPIFSAAIAATGAPATGATYNLFLLSTCEILSQIVATTLIPLMGVYMAFSFVGSVVPNLKIDTLTGAIKTIVTWSLGFLLTIFVGILSIQTMVAQSADSVTIKATRFMIGSFVPVIGNALSEAFGTAQSCLKLIKTIIGAYGVIVSLFTLLPILIQTVIWYLICNIASIISDAFSISEVSALLKACSSVFGILIAIVMCFGLLLIISTTIVMATGMGFA